MTDVDVELQTSVVVLVPDATLRSRAGADARDVGALVTHVFPSTRDEGKGRERDVLLDFFQSTLTNDNTRRSYLAALTRFATWCHAQGLADVRSAKSHHLGSYLAHLEREGLAITTRKQHLAALRMFYVALCQRGLMDNNPAAGVRSPRHSRRRGVTPVLSEEEMRALLAAVPTETLRGLRDRALLLFLFHTFARVSAAVGLTMADVLRLGGRTWVRITEKGGKVLELPMHRSLDGALSTYLDVAGITEGPVFRPFDGRTGRLKTEPLTRTGAFLIVRGYARAAGIEAAIGCHSFRASGITTYLQRGGSLENAQKLAGHATPTTTKLYDRTGDEIAREEVERLPAI
jgi:integrase/recombinase XerD